MTLYFSHPLSSSTPWFSFFPCYPNSLLNIFLFLFYTIFQEKEEALRRLKEEEEERRRREEEERRIREQEQKEREHIEAEIQRLKDVRIV